MVETRRQQIENTASELFRERGYAATSVRDIARALDMQGASLYAHVASKEDVLWSIVKRAADRFDAAVAPIAADDRRPAADRLAAMIRAHIRVVTDDLGNASSFLHEWRFLSDERRADVARRRDGYEARFRDVIAAGHRRAGSSSPADGPAPGRDADPQRAEWRRHLVPRRRRADSRRDRRQVRPHVAGRPGQPAWPRPA